MLLKKARRTHKAIILTRERGSAEVHPLLAAMEMKVRARRPSSPRIEC